nr:RNA-directed DNA polymerase, eukaryota [Tanacetum cinerariifolium]
MEDLTQKISKSVFIINFPDHFSARDLWNVCAAYGKVIDVYIPLKKSKAGKKFGFVRFMMVDNVDRLVENLCIIWIGSYRLRTNPVRFQKEPLTSNYQLKKGNVVDNKNSFASVLKAVGKIKDINALSNLYVILANKGFDNVSLTYLGGYWVLVNIESISSKEKLSKHVGVASWFVELIPASNSFVSENRLVWVSLEGLPIKLWNKAAFAKIVFLWGSLANTDAEDDSSLPFNKVYVVTNHNTIINDKIKIIIKGQLYWICVKELNAWTPKFIDEGSSTSCSDGEDIDANTQDFGNEQRPISEDPFEIYELLNKKKDKEVSKKQVSKDEGPTFPPGFTPNAVDDTVDGKVSGRNKQPNSDSHTSKDGFSGMNKGSNPSLNFKIGGLILQVMEDLVEVGQTMGYNMEGCLKNIEAIVSLHGDSQRSLWEHSSHMIDLWEGESIILGDFNEVRAEHKRFGIINKKRSLLAIRGVLVDGDWIEEPYKVKSEFLNHFTNRFSKHSGPKISFGHQMFKQLSDELKEILESNVTYEEIKKAVWDCGTNKSPGPDGFTFDFIRIYWKIMDQDVVNGVHEFFNSIDFEKAFDFVRWDILDDILNKFGFGAKWRGWIQGCLNSSMGSVLVNGNPMPEFKFHKRLKQGDPLSPFLFILVMESLHLSFNNILNARLFKGICIDDSLSLSHLFYTDDTIFIVKWEKSNFSTIVHMLECFFLALGLKINIQKSKLMGIGIPQEEVSTAANFIGCSTFSTPFNYLGVKVGISCSRSKFWEDVLVKISSRLSRWKIKTLSIGGCYTLTKSVLSSLPLYHMSIYKVPLGVLNNMESIRRKFFNGIDKDEIKMSMIGWNKILASKKKRGLGVSSFFALNRALLLKWIWRFLSHSSSLWTRFIKAMYAKLSDSSLIDSFRRPPRGGVEEEQLLGLIDNIDSVILYNSNDRCVWSLEYSGEFSIKTARSHIDDFFLPSVGDPTRWIKIIPIKINIFAWKVRLDRLPTRINLSLRGIDLPSIICPICCCTGETCSHLLFTCNVARQILCKVAR